MKGPVGSEVENVSRKRPSDILPKLVTRNCGIFRLVTSSASPNGKDPGKLARISRRKVDSSDGSNQNWLTSPGKEITVEFSTTSLAVT